MRRANTLEKTLMLGKTEGKEKGMREGEMLGWHHRLSVHAAAAAAQLLSRVRLFATPWTVAPQAPLSMGILQARILEWVAISSSRGSSQPRDRTQVSCIAGGFLTI